PTQRIEYVRQSHHPEPNRPPTHVRCLRLRNWVEVAIDHAVEGGDDTGDCFSQFGEVEFAVLDVARQVDGPEVTHGGFFVRGYLDNLRAQVGEVHHLAVAASLIA